MKCFSSYVIVSVLFCICVHYFSFAVSCLIENKKKKHRQTARVAVYMMSRYDISSIDALAVYEHCMTIYCHVTREIGPFLLSDVYSVFLWLQTKFTKHVNFSCYI